MNSSDRKRARRRRWLALGAVIAGLLGAIGIGTQAWAHGGWGRHHPSSAGELQVMLDNKMDRLLEKVEADDAQRAQVESIVDRTAPEMFALMQEGRALRKDIKAALLDEQIDRARVEDAKRKLDAWAARTADRGFQSLLEVAEVLTPAQRRQVADTIASMHPGH